MAAVNVSESLTRSGAAENSADSGQRYFSGDKKGLFSGFERFKINFILGTFSIFSFGKTEAYKIQRLSLYD